MQKKCSALLLAVLLLGSVRDAQASFRDKLPEIGMNKTTALCSFTALAFVFAFYKFVLPMFNRKRPLLGFQYQITDYQSISGMLSFLINYVNTHKDQNTKKRCANDLFELERGDKKVVWDPQGNKFVYRDLNNKIFSPASIDDLKHNGLIPEDANFEDGNIDPIIGAVAMMVPEFKDEIIDDMSLLDFCKKIGHKEILISKFGQKIDNIANAADLTSTRAMMNSAKAMSVKKDGTEVGGKSMFSS